MLNIFKRPKTFKLGFIALVLMLLVSLYVAWALGWLTKSAPVTEAQLQTLMKVSARISAQRPASSWWLVSQSDTAYTFVEKKPLYHSYYVVKKSEIGFFHADKTSPANYPVNITFDDVMFSSND